MAVIPEKSYFLNSDRLFYGLFGQEHMFQNKAKLNNCFAVDHRQSKYMGNYEIF